MLVLFVSHGEKLEFRGVGNDLVANNLDMNYDTKGRKTESVSSCSCGMRMVGQK